MLFRTVITAIVLFITAVLPAQQLKEDVRKVNETYAKTKTVSMKIHYRLFQNYATAIPFEDKTGTFIRQGQNYFSQLLGITTVQNGSVKLSVSDADKTIIVSDADRKIAAPSNVMIDSLIKRCSKVEFTDLGEGRKLYRLRFEKTAFFEYDMIDLQFGSNYFIEKIVLFYREAVVLDETAGNMKKEKPKLEISYSEINTQPVVAADQFSETKYIRKSGKTFVPATAFANWKVLNYRKD